LKQHVLTSNELAAIAALLSEFRGDVKSVEDHEFIEHATVLAHELPRSLRAVFNDYRLNEPDAALIVRGLPVDDDLLGPTPAHWKEHSVESPPSDAEMVFFLCGSLLGDAIGWSTQQDGRIMHDVLPIREHEWEQLGSGSRETLTWHTEDAFHPLRTDYVALMCLRNPDKVETTYASVDDLTVDQETLARLRTEKYTIRPDRSHLPSGRGAPVESLGEQRAELVERCYAWIVELDANPEQVAVLFGARSSPYLRLDPFFMEVARDGSPGQEALERLILDIDSHLRSHALVAGDMLFLDNFRAVHGRRSFSARFDGTDRWLKRLNIVRDLRKSRESRESAGSRVIY
jgi:Fe(II)/alpha-ketoglutarate-dependent arginine beta-hydroxylase